MCEYLSELCLVDITTMKHPLSLLSAAVLYVALSALGHLEAYPRALARHARYSLDEVLPVARCARARGLFAMMAAMMGAVCVASVRSDGVRSVRVCHAGSWALRLAAPVRMRACRHIVGLMRKAPESSLRAVYKKHCSSKFGEVAKVEVPALPEADEM